MVGVWRFSLKNKAMKYTLPRTDKACVLFSLIKTFMKKIQQQTPNHNTKFNGNKRRAENKDDIDSREGEEQLTKGDDVTHNRKERKNEKKKNGK